MGEMGLLHGGDWAGFELEYGSLPLDFSANVSPLGLPDGVKTAMIAALDASDRYPDPLCRALCGALATFHGIPAECILCGSGAADLIFRVVQAKHPKTALVTAPTFAEYAQALAVCACQVQSFMLEKSTGFALTPDILNYITPQLDLLFLCEPNNPTGRTTTPQLLREILKKCKACGTLLVVDECFGDFLDEPAVHTLQGMLCAYDNLLILKAFTKCYAMAGVRLGYALCADPALLKKMRQCGQPWAVSTQAQAAGIAALRETAYLAELKQMITAQRPLLQAGLKSLGCTVFAGEANYLLFQCKERALAQRLRCKGVLVRDCSNYPGLGAGFYRIAVRTPQENEKFLKILREVL